MSLLGVFVFGEGCADCLRVLWLLIPLASLVLPSNLVTGRRKYVIKQTGPGVAAQRGLFEKLREGCSHTYNFMILYHRPVSIALQAIAHDG